MKQLAWLVELMLLDKLPATPHTLLLRGMRRAWPVNENARSSQQPSQRLSHLAPEWPLGRTPSFSWVRELNFFSQANCTFGNSYLPPFRAAHSLSAPHRFAECPFKGMKWRSVSACWGEIRRSYLAQKRWHNTYVSIVRAIISQHVRSLCGFLSLCASPSQINFVKKDELMIYFKITPHCLVPWFKI